MPSSIPAVSTRCAVADATLLTGCVAAYCCHIRHSGCAYHHTAGQYRARHSGGEGTERVPGDDGGLEEAGAERGGAVGEGAEEGGVGEGVEEGGGEAGAPPPLGLGLPASVARHLS
eukprot:1106072-Rhodomonas_salina.1